MYIVVIVQRIQKIRDVLARRRTDFDKIFRHMTDFGGAHIPAGSLQRLGNMVKILDLRDKTRAFLPVRYLLGLQRLDFLGPGFNGIRFGITI